MEKIEEEKEKTEEKRVTWRRLREKRREMSRVEFPLLIKLTFNS